MTIIMTFSFCIDSRYTSDSKPLSSIIGNYNVYGNFIYDRYSQLCLLMLAYTYVCSATPNW